MELNDIRISDKPNKRHRLEIRETVGPVQCIREGPYICHNQLVTHATFLKEVNSLSEPRVFNILPIGGNNSVIGDVFALVTWYIMLAYVIAAIPIACYCKNRDINIVNAIVLCILSMYHITAMFIVVKNKKKLRRLIYVAQTTAYKYQGVQNYFFDFNLKQTDVQQFLSLENRRKLREILVEDEDRTLIVMLCCSSYWKTRIVYPIVCLLVLLLFSFAGIFVQLETMRT